MIGTQAEKSANIPQIYEFNTKEQKITLNKLKRFHQEPHRSF